MSTPQDQGHSLLRDLSWAGVLLLALATSFILHRRAGLTFPLPWPDEAVFLWPAEMLAERGTWIAPQLNDSRPILWMPPGYTVLMAAIFRWVPLSLVLSRWISWIFSAAAVAGLLVLYRRQRSTLAILPVVGALAIVPTWVIMGNIARMEGLLLCTTVCGFLLVSSERQWKGIALLGMGPLIHPNGVVFLAAGVVSVILSLRRRNARLTNTDFVAVSAVALLYIGYAILVFRYRAAFFDDMRYQFARKASWSVIGALLAPRSLFLALGIAGAAFASWRIWGRPRPSYWLTVASCVIPVLSGEMWYIVFGDLGILLLLAEWLDIAATMGFAVLGLFGLSSRAIQWLTISVLVAASAISLRFARWLGVTASPVDLPGDLSWDCMRMRAAPYLEQAERRAMVEAVSRLSQRLHASRIQFQPPSDGLLILAERSSEYLPFFPIFTEKKHDLLVIHQASEWRDCGFDGSAPVEQNGRSERPLFHYDRDSGHRWYVFQPPRRSGEP